MKDFMTTINEKPSYRCTLNDLYKNKLSQEVINECLNFSNLCHKLFNSWDNIQNNRKEINKSVLNIKQKIVNNQEDLIKYMEDLILICNNSAFLIPYHTICKDTQHTMDKNIEIYEKGTYFGLLGSVEDIIKEGI